MTGTNDVAVVGLGVMGANLARNFANRGLAVAGYERNAETAQRVASEHPEAQIDIAATFEELVSGLERPRRIVLLVPAGKPVDDVIDALDPLLEQDDIIVDAGNSLYTDTERRIARADERPWRFIGMGVSGGSEGALHGPSMMPGGDEEAWLRLKPVLVAAAARSDSGVCVTYCGRGSAGHFVKMVHNGIEYGDMQLIAETVMLMRRGLGLDAARTASVFDEWNRGELSSYLIEITADILRTPDPERSDGGLLLDAIRDAAGQKGTGRWTVIAAADMGVAIPTIAAALDARNTSARTDLRERAERAFGLDPARSRQLAERSVGLGELRDALYASKIASYAQGFALLRHASDERRYGTDLAEIARIWTGGCIIRARFLDRVRAAFSSEPEPELLALAPDIAPELVQRLPAFRRVIAAASSAGLPVPAHASSLSWLDTLTTSRGSGNLIQAQRDYFGSHGYERRDKPGVSIHTDWATARARRT